MAGLGVYILFSPSSDQTQIQTFLRLQVYVPVTGGVALVSQGRIHPDKGFVDLFLFQVTALSFLTLSLTFIEEPAFFKIATFLKLMVLRFRLHQNHLEGLLQIVRLHLQSF